MSEESKGTIEPQFRNMKSTPGLEIGLRPELGTFELCDEHYDASKTDSQEYCAVCRLEARIALLEEAIALHRAGTKMRAGSLFATPEDAALWALLQEQGE